MKDSEKYKLVGKYPKRFRKMLQIQKNTPGKSSFRRQNDFFQLWCRILSSGDVESLEEEGREFISRTLRAVDHIGEVAK